MYGVQMVHVSKGAQRTPEYKRGTAVMLIDSSMCV
jgi:hypothetical protein